MKKYSLPFFVFFFLACSLIAKAQQFRPAKSADIYKQLQQLQRMGTVMYIAAHPDDENTRLITYLVHHDHINTIYLSLTRGDGGQNIIGNEQGAALGLIRTNEMMMARKLDGGKQLFTRFIDFGFTKSPIETFNFWNKQEVVNDIKNAIQQYKPDVLICRFPTTGEGGHGQHTASAIAALEAFNQLQASKNVSVWKPKRILFNAFKFGSANTIKAGQFELATNQYDPILGEAYGELAGRSRSEHKSQGAGTPQSYGISNENFELMAGSPLQTSLFDGIDTTWNRIGEKEIGQEIAKVISGFQFNTPQQSILPLIKIKNKIAQSIQLKSKSKRESSINVDRLMEKLTDINALIISCAGVQIELLAANPTAIIGESLEIEMKAIARSPNVKINEIIAAQGSQAISEHVTLSSDKLWSRRFNYTIPKSNEITQPYWLTKAGTDNQFHYPSPYKNEALSKNDFIMVAILEIDGAKFPVEVPVSYKKLDPTRGDVIEAVRIMPNVDLEPLSSSITVQNGSPFELNVSVFSRIDFDNASLEISNEIGAVIASKNGISSKKNERKIVNISIPKQVINGIANPEKLYYNLKTNGQDYDKQLHLIQYPHIPTLQYFTKASTNVLTKNWETKVQNIGYIAGAGDKVAESLSELGLNVTQLADADLSTVNNLKQYDAIVCGVRFANTRKDLEKRLPELWKYIDQGGTVLMQYNTSIGLELKNFSPLLIEISRDRVTDENAKVTFTQSNSKVLQQPNKIDQRDFQNWVQERGVYYPGTWDKAFQTVLSMSDPDEKPLESGILYAQYGKGYFIYSPLAFFRQLPAGNPGAIRLFLNLLSVGK